MRQVVLTTDALGRAAVTVNPVTAGPVVLEVKRGTPGAGGGNDDRANEHEQCAGDRWRRGGGRRSDREQRRWRPGNGNGDRHRGGRCGGRGGRRDLGRTRGTAGSGFQHRTGRSRNGRADGVSLRRRPVVGSGWEQADIFVGLRGRRAWSGGVVTHVYEAAGRYTVTLTVSDGDTSASSTGQVVVNPSLEGATLTGSIGQIDDGSGRSVQEVAYLGRGRIVLRVDGRVVYGENGLEVELDGSNNYVCPCSMTMSTGGSGYSFAGTVNEDTSEIPRVVPMAESHTGHGGRHHRPDDVYA